MSGDTPNQRKFRLAEEADAMNVAENSSLDISAASDGSFSLVDSSFDISALKDTAISDTSHYVNLPDIKEFVKKFELNTGLNGSSVVLLSDTCMDDSMTVTKNDKLKRQKENFLNFTEEMSKVLHQVREAFKKRK